MQVVSWEKLLNEIERFLCFRELLDTADEWMLDFYQGFHLFFVSIDMLQYLAIGVGLHLNQLEKSRLLEELKCGNCH